MSAVLVCREIIYCLRFTNKKGSSKKIVIFLSFQAFVLICGLNIFWK
jgi:hypothetical protein